MLECVSIYVRACTHVDMCARTCVLERVFLIQLCFLTFPSLSLNFPRNAIDSVFQPLINYGH